MQVAITGGTGFVGRHLAKQLVANGQEVVLIARGADRRDPAIYDLQKATFVASDLSSAKELERAFIGCDAVAHCAGINREIGAQTYARVHVEGTRHVVEAARDAGVRKIVLLSFLRARPSCESAYHESKWAAEEIVRASGLDCTVIKAGVIYGRGDHMLDHLSRALHTFPVFGLVGMREKPIRPLAAEDLINVLEAALSDVRLSRKTFGMTGPEEMTLGEAVRRVGSVIGRRPFFVRLPVALHCGIAWIAERVMKIPMVSLAQLRILSEGIVDALPACDALPDDLVPTRCMTAEHIRRGLPEPGPFRLSDLRCMT